MSFPGKYGSPVVVFAELHQRPLLGCAGVEDLVRQVGKQGGADALNRDGQRQQIQIRTIGQQPVAQFSYAVGEPKLGQTGITERIDADSLKGGVRRKEMLSRSAQR